MTIFIYRSQALPPPSLPSPGLSRTAVALVKFARSLRLNRPETRGNPARSYEGTRRNASPVSRAPFVLRAVPDESDVLFLDLRACMRDVGRVYRDSRTAVGSVTYLH